MVIQAVWGFLFKSKDIQMSYINFVTWILRGTLQDGQESPISDIKQKWIAHWNILIQYMILITISPYIFFDYALKNLLSVNKMLIGRW